jgi:hypothetical protein
MDCWDWWIRQIHFLLKNGGILLMAKWELMAKMTNELEYLDGDQNDNENDGNYGKWTVNTKSGGH